MEIIAIIAEYNPFHLGHARQIAAARRFFGQDCPVIVAMSGSFTQRGEPALLDKWTRTRIALSSGADLVFELPFISATASAQGFARGGVRLLQATGLRTRLVFGSESGQLEDLDKLAGFLADESDDFRLALRQGLEDGLSFAAARQQAAAACLETPELAALLSQSNNILAVEYLMALQLLSPRRLQPWTNPREGQSYRESSWQNDQQASASAIRAIVRRLRDQDNLSPARAVTLLRQQMPAAALAEILQAWQKGPGPLFQEDFAVPIISLLRRADEPSIDQVPGMAEGLGRRLLEAARRPGTDAGGRLETLCRDAATRRFPRTRINRALLSLLSGTTKEDLEQAGRNQKPPYLRVLGFSRQGRYLLRMMRKTAECPIILNASDFLEHQQDPFLSRMAALDIRSTDLWFLQAGERCGRDFDTPPIMR